jgi:hypothetical protein
MFSSLLGELTHPLSGAVRDAVRLAGWGAAIALAGVLAFSFFLVAAFVWAEQRYGTLEAALLLGTFFLIVAGALVIALVLLRRRASKPPPPKTVAPWWRDPAVIAIGVELVRHVKVQRVVPAMALGAVIVALMQASPDRRPR